MIEVARIGVFPFLLSFLVCLLLTPVTIFLFNKLGWVIDPSKTPHPAHIHKEPIPKGGGLPVLLSFAISAFFFLPPDKYLLAIMVAGLVTVVVGIVDDIRGSSPYLRLVVNFLVAAIIIFSGIGISFVSNPFGGILDLSWPGWYFNLSDLLTLLWIPILMNAINWSSGVDGQISGVVVIAALVLGGISLNYSADITQWPVSVLAFSLAGAFVGLTIFHFYPQKIMPGYSATSLAGLMLGVISILATAKIGALIMVLAIPLVDFCYLIVKRVRDGKSPVWGGRDHLHHKLMSLGWGKRRIALFYWGIALVMGTVSLTFKTGLKLMFVIGLVLISFFSLWHLSSRSSKR